MHLFAAFVCLFVCLLRDLLVIQSLKLSLKTYIICNIHFSDNDDNADFLNQKYDILGGKL